jgi:Ni2+-binding GTPase involved in maturation of urease and hydrogenase
MFDNPRFIMIGGFLGAGKTTTVSRIARHYQAQGKHVVIVTNDQAADLVDTNLLRSQGYDVGEVAGSCFCCNFNALTSTVEQLGESRRPDVILAEPVGSCTDLVATVIRPLRDIYGKPIDIAPYGVIIKPSHGTKILQRQKGGFSPQAEYIFRKQIEEADFVMLNRIDELTSDQITVLTQLLEEQFPGRSIVQMSARTGAGLDTLVECLEQQGDFGRRVMEVDYDVYAEGEADLGWLNCQLTLEAGEPVDIDQFLLGLVSRLQRDLGGRHAEIAHLKVIGTGDGFYGVANVISSEDVPSLSLASRSHASRADLVVNARVSIAPETLQELVEAAIAREARQAGARAMIQSLQSFRPGRPVPTHRLS